MPRPLATLQGTLAAAGPWQSLFARVSHRVYPFTQGTRIRLDSTSTTAYVDGIGSFKANDYFIVCAPTYYGGSPLYIPDTSRISRVGATDGPNQQLTITALALRAGDWLINLGSDTAANPIAGPNYDGSPITLYSGPVDNSATGLPYLDTGQGGWYFGWITTGVRELDLLILNSSGEPVIAHPHVHAGTGLESVYSVTQFGATGDGTTDDTNAIQAALDTASAQGGAVYFPVGDYRTSGPVTVQWSPTNTPNVSRIFGEGKKSVIRNYSCGSGRAALEIIGESNGVAVTNFRLHDLVIHQYGSLTGGSVNSGAYGLRVGDLKEGFEADNVLVRGANGLAIKIASSVSYAVIAASFKNCYFRSNYDNGWFANDTGTTQYAVFPESGGAYWDNVHFDNCNFWGTVQCRSAALLFSNCLFGTSPNRAAGYNGCVGINLGAAKLDTCYFEDYITAVTIAGTSGAVRSATLQNCYFSNSTNIGTFPERAIDMGDGAYGTGTVHIQDCVFGTTSGSFTVQHIRIDGTTSGGPRFVRIENNHNFTSPGTELTITRNASFTRKYWIQHETGKIETNAMTIGTADGTSSVVINKSVDSSGLTAGASTAGIELWNPNTALPEGCESSIVWRGRDAGTGSDLAERWGAIYGRALTHNPNVGITGYVAIATKPGDGDTALSERLRVAADGTVTVKQTLVCEGLYRAGTRDSITAAVTQSQGNQPLTDEINEVSTVANANDVVTLPTAAAGLRVTVINNGANTLQIFPALNDQIDALSVDASTTLPAGTFTTFIAYNATNWIST